MLVFCSHRGRSLECRKCEHSVAHEPIHRNGGPFTCDGGHQCLMAEAVAGVGMDTVVDGEERVYEVRCVPVVQMDVSLLGKVESALRGLCEQRQGWDRRTAVQYGERILGEVQEERKKVERL